MKTYRYTVVIIDAKGDRRVALENENSLVHARNIARAIKQKNGRKVVIERDGKELPKGPYGLDDAAYQLWLEENRPEEEA